MTMTADKIVANNQVVANGREAIRVFNESTAKLESALHKGIYALCAAIGTAYEYETDRFLTLEILNRAAIGKGTDDSTKEARRILADGVFGFDSVNSTKTNNLNPTNSQAQFIVRCAVVAAYLMDGFKVGMPWELTVNDKGEYKAGNVNMSSRGSKLMVPGSKLYDDEHADYDRAITMNGERGKAVSDLHRKAKAHFAADTGNPNEAHDARKKTLNAILGSTDGDAKAAGIATITDVLTEELAKVAKGGKLADKLKQSLSNLSAHITELEVADDTSDMDYMGVARDFLTMARNIAKMPPAARAIMFEAHDAIDDYIAETGTDQHADWLSTRKAA